MVAISRLHGPFPGPVLRPWKDMTVSLLTALTGLFREPSPRARPRQRPSRRHDLSGSTGDTASPGQGHRSEAGPTHYLWGESEVQDAMIPATFGRGSGEPELMHNGLARRSGIRAVSTIVDPGGRSRAMERTALSITSLPAWTESKTRHEWCPFTNESVSSFSAAPNPSTARSVNAPRSSASHCAAV